MAVPFLLSDDEELIARTVATFAQDSIGLDAAHDTDRHDRFPADHIAAAAQLGLTGLLAPEGAAGPTAFVLALDAVAAVCPNTAAVLATHNVATRLLEGDVRAAACGGEVVAMLATEEAFGSDKSRLSTRVEDGRITGQKVWGLGAAGAKHFLVLAEDGGPTWYHVPADSEGVALGAHEALLGLRGAGIRTVYFSDVANATRLGAKGEGAAAHRELMPWLQVGIAACLNGCAEGAKRAAVAFAEDRVQFKKPIGTYQAVSDHLVRIDTRLEASRALTLRAAAHLDEGGVWAARAKAVAADMAIEATRLAIRVQGGTGFMREGVAERFARDARALQFMGEPPIVQRDVVRRHLMDLDFGVAP